MLYKYENEEINNYQKHKERNKNVNFNYRKINLQAKREDIEQDSKIIEKAH